MSDPSFGLEGVVPASSTVREREREGAVGEGGGGGDEARIQGPRLSRSARNYTRLGYFARDQAPLPAVFLPINPFRRP